MEIFLLIISGCDFVSLQVLEANVAREENDAVLNSLIDLAEHRPKFLRSHLERLLEILIKVHVHVCTCIILYVCIVKCQSSCCVFM